jgi:hypothetical protein
MLAFMTMVVQPQRHAAKFYETEASLYTTVANFLSEGMIAGQPAVVIARPSHAAAIQRYLTDRSIDVPRARRAGDLILLDAEDMLGTFMIGGHPDAELFQLNVGTILDRVLRGRSGSQIRAYGEMVDVLWKAGHSDAAIGLELLWNKLALKHAFSLLCGYAMGNFFKQAEQFHNVCQHHSHVCDPATNAVSFDKPAGDYA